VDYCALQDVFNLGLDAQAFRSRALLSEGVVPSTGTITLSGNGLSLNAQVSLVVMSSSTLGAAPAAVPTGLAVGTPYYALPVSGSSMLLQLAATQSGSPITFSDGGAGAWGILIDPTIWLAAAITAASLVIDQYSTAHAAPINAAVLTLVAARLAAHFCVAAHSMMSPAFSGILERPSMVDKLIRKLLDFWVEGAPIKGATDATPSIADDAPRARCNRPVGWGRRTL
jgi:hypothetical protein